MASTHPTPRFAPGQVVTVFRSRLAADPAAQAAYDTTANHMDELARAMPGHVEHKTFTASDGERVTLVTFADEASQVAWRDQVQHRAAQQAGRDRFYAGYSIQVATCTRAHTFTAPAPGARVLGQ